MNTLSFREFLELSKDIKLPDFTFEEILTKSSEISKELVFKHKELYSNFKEYLVYGAYPFFLEGIDSFGNKLHNALEKIIYEDIPSLNKIEYSHISIFEKLIFFVTSANKPFSVSVASLSRELGISEPTLNSYLQILDNTGIFKSLRKKSKKVSKKPQKLLFSNTNILYTYANKIDLALDIGVVRETFFVNCFKDIYYSDIGDFIVKDKIFEIGGKNKTFKRPSEATTPQGKARGQVKDIPNSFLAIDIDFTSNDKKIPLWLFSFLKSK
jgi:predicted AAA+ superfamily ATPase